MRRELVCQWGVWGGGGNQSVCVPIGGVVWCGSKVFCAVCPMWWYTPLGIAQSVFYIDIARYKSIRTISVVVNVK